MNGVSYVTSSIKTALGVETNVSPLKARNENGSTGTNFDKIVETSTSFDGIDVSLYKSRETGLKVLIANVEVPIVCDFRCYY